MTKPTKPSIYIANLLIRITRRYFHFLTNRGIKGNLDMDTLKALNNFVSFINK